MRTYLLLYSFLVFSLVLEASVVRLPLTLVAIILIALIQKKNSVFLLCFIAGVLLDSAAFRIVGTTSAFLLFVVGILFLYGRKYETYHIGFACVFLFVSSVVYEYIFGLPDPFLAAFLATGLGMSIFLPIQIFVLNQPQKLGM